ncbi:hypothetical protein HY249_00055 [Candidatus Azambacteria bacterium]|nr:hypothetical protein [Candidatus Azambacteria bacterium]
MDGQNEQKPKRFFLGRTIFLAVLFIIILNFIFLAPSLNEIKDRVYEHQIEITERIITK